jgi:hypothetical protein
MVLSACGDKTADTFATLLIVKSTVHLHLSLHWGSHVMCQGALLMPAVAQLQAEGLTPL